ncbi:MAG: hypothetical protein LBH93_02895 [Chitinispirillales bacterium]|jgi:hypothetical protein|nr:hypothetical protein [Chitinispirillales bacterium]
MLFDSDGKMIEDSRPIGDIGISLETQNAIKNCFLGSVLASTKLLPNDSFSIKKLFGGKNGDWSETPLQELYDHYARLGNDETTAMDNARKDAGKLLKTLLIKLEKRSFRVKKIHQQGHDVNEYCLIINEE